MPAFYVGGSDPVYHNSLAIFILFFIKLRIHKVDSLFLAKIGVLSPNHPKFRQAA
jgi:hypothetical protein